jgi:hypothetical protein
MRRLVCQHSPHVAQLPDLAPPLVNATSVCGWYGWRPKFGNGSALSIGIPLSLFFEHILIRRNLTSMSLDLIYLNKQLHDFCI